MEPRIATLLGDSAFERPVLDPVSHLPHTSAAPRQPHPLESSTTSDGVSANTSPNNVSGLSRNRQHTVLEQPQSATKRQKPSVPIAGVLNNETPTPANVQSVPAASASVTPFSGRLSDLLLDPSQQHSLKRKRVDEPANPLAPTGAENSLLKLPRPHQQTKKPAKRPRIPPLLQGLHQPPAFAQSRLFPPITSESGAFGRDIGDSVGLPNASGSEQRKESNGSALPSGDRLSGNQKISREKDAGKTTTTTSDKENQASRVTSDTPAVAAATKELKRRKKWSDQETKDLLVGVSRFGIGNWKKILQCPDFTFNSRTAVDLKDRFRTCCPGEGLKPRKPKRKTASQDDDSPSTATSSAHTSMSTSQDFSTQDSTKESSSRKPRTESHRKGPAELREMGIHGAFTKKDRRERRVFTEQDDENLLKGFGKYSSSWHLMRDDKDLGFSSRHPTDLRDRFRIRFPEKFAKAGYKLKPKDQLMMQEKQGKEDSQEFGNSERASDLPASRDTTIEASFSSLASAASSNPNLMPLTLREPLLTSFPGPLEFGDLASEDGDHIRSPIILSRNIFEWADANPSQISAASGAGLPTMTHFAGDGTSGILQGTDDTHISPLITLNLPMSVLTSSALSSAVSPYPPSSNPPASSRLPEPFHHNNPSSGTTTTAPTTSAFASASTAKQAVNPLLRTPNLPTIVFPHVPASSARSAMHNLPPPADLLSGLEMDTRSEMQNAHFMLEDNGGFTMPSTGNNYAPAATLAPLVNSLPGRGLLGLEKGLSEEVVQDKR